MAVEADDPRQPESDAEEPQVYSVRREPNGWRFTRRGFLTAIAASAAAVDHLAHAARSEPSQRVGADSIPAVKLYSGPGEHHVFIDMLQHGEWVMLVERGLSRPWSQVETLAGRVGWIANHHLDFSRSVRHLIGSVQSTDGNSDAQAASLSQIADTQPGTAHEATPEPNETIDAGAALIASDTTFVLYLPIIGQHTHQANTSTPTPTVCSCHTICICDPSDPCVAACVCTCDSVTYWYPN